MAPFNKTLAGGSALLLLLIALLLAVLTGRARTEHFSEPPTSMTGVGASEADWSSCTLPDGYAFKTEGLAQHISSTKERPLCVVVKDGAGLLTKDGNCGLTSDLGPTSTNPSWVDAKYADIHPDWSNPLSDALYSKAVITSISKQDVSGVQRCVVELNPLATASTATTLDDAIRKAGAELRSQKPWIEQSFKEQVAKLTEDLARATAATAAATAARKAAEEKRAADQKIWNDKDSDRKAQLQMVETCNSTNLPEAKEKASQKAQEVVDCKSNLNGMPTVKVAETDVFDAILNSLNAKPFGNLQPACIVNNAWQAYRNDKGKDKPWSISPIGQC